MSSDASTAPPSGSSKPELDQDFYNWSTFFSILPGSATDKAADAYFKRRDDLHEAADCARGEDHKAWLLRYSPIVRFMRQNINKLGQDIDESSIHCRRCTTRQSGGFDPEYGILICANQLRNRGHMEDTLAHEMVHAWDFLRFKYKDQHDLRHAACTEVGATHWTRELLLTASRFGHRRYQGNVASGGSSSHGVREASHSSCRSACGGGPRCPCRRDRDARIRNTRQRWSTKSGTAASTTHGPLTRSTASGSA